MGATVKKTYRWKELSDDGLLKEPEIGGYHYDGERLNGYGFESSAEAIAEFVNFKERYGSDITSRLVLIEVFDVTEG